MSDLIEREAALCPKFTWPGKFNRRTFKIVTEVMNKYGEYLAALPSAQTERKEGRWENIEDDSWMGGGYTKCSACGYGYSWGAHHEPDEWDFCPHCGAKMRPDNAPLPDDDSIYG